MVKASRALLTDRQIEILKLRRQGLTQKEIAKRLRTTRENINILESRAHRNIRRATETLEALDSLDISTRVIVTPKTHVLDIPRIILEKADEANIRVKTGCIDILERVGSKARSKIRYKHTVKPIAITILPDGNFIVE